MFESSYLLDPGSHTLRLYDPKTKTILQKRACRLEKEPDIIAEDALKASWSSNEKIVWPFMKEAIEADPAPLLKALFAKAPAERFLLVPNASVLSFQAPSEELSLHWQNLLEPYKLGRIKMAPAFVPEGNKAFFRIHAGNSLVHFVMGMDGRVLGYKPLAIAGLAVDQAISAEIARVFKVLISAEDACALKESVSNALKDGRDPVLQVTGLNQHNQFEQLRFRASDLWGAMEPVLQAIALQAAEFVCSKGVELMEQVLANPVLLTGGLASCYGLASLLQKQLHARVRIPENPDTILLETAAKARRPF